MSMHPGYKKSSSVTFKDQVMHPISSSDLNKRYATGHRKPPMKAMSRKAPLNSRYIDGTEFAKELEIDTPRYSPPPPLITPRETEPSLHATSDPLYSVQEATQSHQQIMGEITEEITRRGSNRYPRQQNGLDHQNNASASSARNGVSRNFRRDRGNVCPRHKPIVPHGNTLWE